MKLQTRTRQHRNNMKRVYMGLSLDAVTGLYVSSNRAFPRGILCWVYTDWLVYPHRVAPPPLFNVGFP